jgi:hypothetical protein
MYFSLCYIFEQNINFMSVFSQASLCKLCTHSYGGCYSSFVKVSERLSCVVVYSIKREKL